MTRTKARPVKPQVLSTLQIRHSMRDDRIDAQTTLTTMAIQDYLTLTNQSEENLDIQRRILPTGKIYERLQKDLKLGATIPPIVLAVAERDAVVHTTSGPPRLLSLRKLNSASIYIVDGLQRTNHLRQVAEQLHGADHKEFMKREVRVEIWTDISFSSVLYRMMLLNAAQTPMTLRHQLEVVNLHMTSLIHDHASSIDVLTEKSERRRVDARQFKASDLVEAFVAFVKRTPLTDAKSLIVEELDREDFLEGFDRNKYEKDIKTFVCFLGDLDSAICEKYADDIMGDNVDTQHGVKRGTNFLGTRPYLLGVAAAAGAASSRLDREDLKERTQKLIDLVNGGTSDPLDLESFNSLLSGLLQSSGRIGDTQREFVFNAFKEYLLDSGSQEFSYYWKNAARKI